MLGKAAVMRRLGKPVFNCSIDLLKKGAYSPLGSWSPQRRTYSKVETFDYNSFGKTLDLECSLKESSGTATNVQNLPERGAKGLSLLEGIKEIMDTNPDHVVLTQVGSFYELYYDHAVIYGPKLGIRVTKRKSGGKGSETAIAMAGFPVSQLDRYLRILVQESKCTVAIVDQFEKPTPESDVLDLGPTTSEWEKMKFDRRISRIITPGTLIDESFINWETNNFLVALGMPVSTESPTDDTPVGIAWLNLALGNFYIQSSTMKDLLTDLARIQPSEIIIDKRLQKRDIVKGTWHPKLQDLEQYYFNYQNFPSKDQIFQFTSLFDDTEANVRFHFSEMKSHEVSALMGILKYVKVHLPESPIQVQIPERVNVSQLMKMDSRSRAALELTKSIRDGSTQGTLLSTIKRTITESGTRLLSEWIKEPLLAVKEINARQDLVQQFLENKVLQKQVESFLFSIGDPSRIIQKFGLGRGNAMDLLIIAQDLDLMATVRSVLLKLDKTNHQVSALGRLAKKIDPCKSLRNAILDNLDENVLLVRQQKEEREREILESELLNETVSILPQKSSAFYKVETDDWMVKPSASGLLKKYHDNLESTTQAQLELKQSLKEKYPGFKLELKWSQSLGFHAHITGKIHEINDEELLSQTLTRHKKTIAFRNLEWTALGESLEQIKSNIRAEEKKVINRLKQKVYKMKNEIRRNCTIMDQIDVLNSFANLARERQLVRPHMLKKPQTVIKDGRHLAVESGLYQRTGEFIANDCELGSNGKSSLWLITGPNMGGKSTFLRQVALISILGQMGSYVPATHANLGIVDQIFCRVGAGDDLYRDQSTFMVEMLETTNILRNATPNSLAILDEVGRGTSGKDGLAIAFATLMHLIHNNKCRTLFATHFGNELHDLLKTQAPKNSIGYYCTDIDFFEPPPDLSAQSLTSGLTRAFAFSHKLREGISQDSHGLRIAVMAGFPLEAIQFAQGAIQRLESDK